MTHSNNKGGLMNDKKIPKIITTLALCGGLIVGFNTLKTPVYANDDAQTVITNDENGLTATMMAYSLKRKPVRSYMHLQ